MHKLYVVSFDYALHRTMNNSILEHRAAHTPAEFDNSALLEYNYI